MGDYLGVDQVIWLGQGTRSIETPTGTSTRSRNTSGLAAILLDVPGDPADPYHAAARTTWHGCARRTTPRAGAIEVVVFDAGTPAVTAYMNHYLVNGGVIVPGGRGAQRRCRARTAEGAYPDREIVTVPGAIILEGGGGPHCITQQIPDGSSLA